MAQSEALKLRDIGQTEHHAPINTYLNRSLHFATIVLEFVQKKSHIQKQFAEQMEALLSATRKQTSELFEKKKYTKEVNQVAELWETLMIVTETEVHGMSELGEALNKKVAVGLANAIEKKRQEIKEINKDKAALEAMIAKLEADVEKAGQLRMEALKPLVAKDGGGFFRKRSASSLKQNPDDASFIAARTAHNEYVMRLKETNAMRRRYYEIDLLDLFDRLEEHQSELETATKNAIEGLASSTSIAYQPMAAMQEKITNMAAETDITQDIPAFVSTLRTAPYERPRDLSFIVPGDKTLDISWTLDSLIVSGAEIVLGQTMQGVTEEVNTLAASISEKNKAIIALEKLKSSYETETKFGQGGDVMPQIVAAQKERRQLHIKLQGLYAVLEALQAAHITDADGGTRHDFRTHTYKKTVKCAHCLKKINVLQQGLKCKTCRINIHDKCRAVGSSCGSSPAAASSAPAAAAGGAADAGDDEEEVWSDDEEESSTDPTSPASAPSSSTTTTATPTAPPRPAPPGSGAGAGAAKGTQRATVLYDYTAASGEEMSITTGETLDLIQCDAADPWWLARCGSRQGLVPASYVQRLESAAARPAPPAPPPAAAPPAQRGMARALHPYAGMEDGQLSFPAGAVIEVVRGDEGGWSTGRYDGEEGIFPTAYVAF